MLATGGACDGRGTRARGAKRHALITVGTAKHYLGDATGTEDLERGTEDRPCRQLLDRRQRAEQPAVSLRPRTTSAESGELFDECFDVAERMGDRDTMRFAEGNLAWSDWACGDWDAALARADAFIAVCEAGSPHYLEHHVRETRATILLARGAAEAALADFERARDLGRLAGDPQAYLPAVGTSAHAYALLGRIEEARALAQEFVATAQELEDKPMAVTILAGFAAERRSRSRDTVARRCNCSQPLPGRRPC